jgi:hypothetical protein
MTTNAAIELRIAREISGALREMGLAPAGYQCQVSLRRGTRKKRKDAVFDANWDAGIDSVQIAFSPMDEAAENTGETMTDGAGMSVDTRLADTVRALNRAEGRPGYDFVSLKWFRDAALPSDNIPWANDASARHEALREAIDRRWILTSKIANPRPPHFPVTAIRLNRTMPEVSDIIGGDRGGLAAFRPIAIRGESLSATVSRDRR